MSDFIAPVGYPLPLDTHPDIEVLGANCCISKTVSIWRRQALNPDNPLIRLDEGVVVFDYVRLVAGSKAERPEAGITLGKRVMINSGSFLSGEGGLILEDEVLIGPHVKILSAGHELDHGHSSIYRNAITYAPVHIKEGAWVGAGATITQGVTIGRGAVIAAGALVTKDVPDHAVMVGVPATLQRYRKFNE